MRKNIVYEINPDHIHIKDMTKEQYREYMRLANRNYYATHIEYVRKRQREKYYQRKADVQA